MKEVLECLHYTKGVEARTRILKSIINNKLSKDSCRKVAQEFLDAKLLYKPLVR